MLYLINETFYNKNTEEIINKETGKKDRAYELLKIKE